jgi:hypothetical protein
MVRRHDREGEEHVACQRKIIERLLSEGDVAKTARQLLMLFEETPADRCQHLALLLHHRP